MRVFYVIYIHDEPLRSCIDAMRLMYDPLLKHRAHITVRGPYKQRYNFDEQYPSIKGDVVTLHRLEMFFERDQHTVFFNCSARHLHDVWYKRDFSDFKPHLTLYDGHNRNEAVEFYQVLTRYPISVSFAARGLEPLISNGQPGMNVVDSLDYSALAEITRLPISADFLMEADRSRRLQIADRICRFLSQASSGSKEPVALAPGDVGLPSGWAATSRPGTGWPRTPSERGSTDASVVRRIGLMPASDPWLDWEFLHQPQLRPA